MPSNFVTNGLQSVRFEKGTEYVLSRGTDYVAGATNHIATTTDADPFQDAHKKGMEEVRKGAYGSGKDIKEIIKP